MGLRSGLLSGLNPLASVDAGRQYPANLTAWTAAFPSITAPTAIWQMQAASSPVPDEVGSDDLSSSGSPTFEASGEDGRVSVEATTTNDRLELAGAGSFDADGATDITVFGRFFVPASPTTGALFGKRGGSGNPGYYCGVITGSGYIIALHDGGTPTAGDTLEIDHRGQWVDVALVIDETANEFRIETSLGSATVDNTSVGDSSSTAVLCFGQVPGILGTFLGWKCAYAAAWDGTALTRAQLLEIWGQS